MSTHHLPKSTSTAFLLLVITIVMSGLWIQKKILIERTSQASIQNILDSIEKGGTDDHIRSYLSELSEDEIVEFSTRLFETGNADMSNETKDSLRIFYREAFLLSEQKFQQPLNKLSPDQSEIVVKEVCQKRIPTPRFPLCPPR